MDRYEELERSLDPHRGEEQAAVAAEVAARLRDRGVTVTGAERPEDLADLLSAVERFEAAVEAHGGDLMVDDLKSSEPDDEHFVVPRRDHGEAIRAYIGRIDDAAARLRRHPRHID
jgi:hypothetical protein